MEPGHGTDPEGDTQSQTPTSRSADKPRKRPTKSSATVPHLPSPDLRTFPPSPIHLSLSPRPSHRFPIFQLPALLSSRTRGKNHHRDPLLRGVPLKLVRSSSILFRPPSSRS